MIFRKKKREDKLEDKQEQTAPPTLPMEFNVMLTLWDGKNIKTTITSQFPVDFKEMAKNVIKDGLFMNNEQIVRVNEIQLIKDKEIESEILK